MRYLTFFVATPFVVLWLVRKYGIRILVAQSPYEGFAAAWAKIISRVLFGEKVRLIVESHGDFEHFGFQEKSTLSWVCRPIMERLAYFAIGHADALRAVSKATKKQLEIRSSKKPIVKFPAWTDIEIFLKAGEQKGVSETQTILFVGSLVPDKGVHVLTESFAHIAEEFETAQLILIGKPQDQHYANTLMQSQRPDLEGRIEFLGQLPQSQVAYHMAKAAVLVLPSFSEGLGRVIFEAMACGTPVIGSRIGGIPDLIRDEVNGFLVPPRDESALSRKISWILNNPIKTREMGARAREFAEKYFSSQIYVQEYSRLFELARPKENCS